MAEKDPLVHGNIVMPISEFDGGGPAGGINGENLGGQERAVITIGKGENTRRAYDHGETVHLGS
jgi:hypothetical protein